MSGNSDYNINFTDLQNLIIALGFKKNRQNGSHQIYKNEELGAKINLQNSHGKAKAYQVNQVREIIKKYNL